MTDYQVLQDQILILIQRFQDIQVSFIRVNDYNQMKNLEIKAIFLALIIALAEVPMVKADSETFTFNTQVTRLMDILINSLYSQKEIFLREVISNASDALDKLRFLALTDETVLGDNKNLEIRIRINEPENYIAIRDTGVGMTKQQLIENLGTIAKSGTTSFLEALTGGNINLIGQFGVGFYSTFLAGYKVEVITKSNRDVQYKWISEAAASYTIEQYEGEPIGRGTEVRIYLKEDSKKFLNEHKIENLIRKYSQFIDFPIYLQKKIETEVDAPVEEEDQSDEDIEVSEKKEGEKKKIKKTELQWEQINTNKAIWLRDEEDLYEEDYVEFYKSLSRQTNPPLNWIHFETDGEVVFTSILFIPNRAPHDFYSHYNTRKNDLKLYVRRVLIAEKHSDLIPKYLSFAQGVIDSDDLPLKVDRETLIQNKAFKVINQKITKKILDMISEIAKWQFVDEDEFDEDEQEDDEQTLTAAEIEEKRQKSKEAALKKNKERFDNFYNQFGKAVKLGVIDDKNNRKKLASLTRWRSTHNESELTSFDDYIKRMKSVQDQIYFASGEDRKVLMKSPLVVGLVTKGYEVILCDDPIDEYVFGVLREYEGKNIVNVGKGDFKMPDDDEFDRKKQKFLTKKFNPFIQYAKKILYEEVGNVIVSNRLTTEPCVVVADSYGHSSFMDKIQKASMFAGANDNPMQNFKKILEINPHHKVNQIILEKINNNQADEEVEELIQLLYETAAFNSGFSAKDPNSFVKRFYKIYSKAMGVVNLERNQIEVENDVELSAEDYQGENEQQQQVLGTITPDMFAQQTEEED